jgi:predicted aspartyl protease
MKYIIGLAAVLLSAPAIAEPLIYDNGRIFVRATLKGIPTEALLDSGAEASLIDPALAKRAGLPPGVEIEMKGSGGKEKARFVYGPHIVAGGIDLGEQELVILDLRDISKRLIKRPTAMILGRQMFDAGRLRVDLLGGTWEVLKPDQKLLGTKLTLEKHAGIEAAPVAVNGVSALADFDLGNGSKVMISKAMVAKLGLKTIGQEKGGGIGGELVRDLVTIDRLDVAGKTFRNVTAGVDALDNAGDLNIGTAILQHFIVTTDFPGRAVYLEPRVKD